MIPVLLAGILLAVPGHASAQVTAPPPNVQIHVGGDPQLRALATDHLTTTLRASATVRLAERNPDYVLSVIVLPVASAGFALSATVMSVHTDDSLGAVARLWGLDPATTGRLQSMFKGNGALVDQRVMTGPDLEALCRDIATAFTADTVARARR